MITFIARISRDREDYTVYQCQSCGEVFFYSDLDRHCEDVHGKYNWDIDYQEYED